MENIIKTTRLQRGITQREVAKLAGMSPQGVMRYEQGLYENLSVKLRDAIVELTDWPPYKVDQLYHAFRVDTQIKAQEYLADPPPIHFTETRPPFLNFREGLTSGAVGTKSRMAFCIMLAVHPATVQQYDEGKVKYMPALIKRALINGGLNGDYLKSLCEVGEIWYERHSAHR